MPEMDDNVDLTKERCPKCGVKGNWLRAEQNDWHCYLQCARCLCHIILYKRSDGRIFEHWEEASVS